MISDLQILNAQETRGFLFLVAALGNTERPRLPIKGKRLMLSVEREGGGLDSFIVERRPGEGPARYSVTKVRNVAIDAVTHA